MGLKGLKKKRNVIILTVCMIFCFTLYQLYFFLTITSVTVNSNVVPVIDHDEVKQLLHLRSEDDKYVSESGMLRGVYFSHVLQYRPDGNEQFKCRTSEQRIPFEQMNDDYCDCEDGTDEPSTSACPGGMFYCENQKRILTHQTIPSSQVNDGICDCCDGSDEWLHKPNQKLLSQTDSKHHSHYVIKCPNVCGKNV